MFWEPPKVQVTPKMKTAYKLLSYINKRYSTRVLPNDKHVYVPNKKVEYEIQKLAKIIAEEQRGLQQLEKCIEPLFVEMGNSIAANATKSLGFEYPDDSTTP